MSKLGAFVRNVCSLLESVPSVSMCSSKSWSESLPKLSPSYFVRQFVCIPNLASNSIQLHAWWSVRQKSIDFRVPKVALTIIVVVIIVGVGFDVVQAPPLSLSFCNNQQILFRLPTQLCCDNCFGSARSRFTSSNNYHITLNCCRLQQYHSENSGSRLTHSGELKWKYPSHSLTQASLSLSLSSFSSSFRFLYLTILGYLTLKYTATLVAIISQKVTRKTMSALANCSPSIQYQVFSIIYLSPNQK